MKILVVEDFAIDREEVVSILQSFRDLSIEEIRTCENGMTALEMTDTFVPDVILCDVEMPYMDGFTLLREVRAQYPDMRFVFCSLYNRVEYFKNALDLDSNGYLLKPLDPMQLHDCLQRFSQQGQLLSSQREELSQLREQVEKNRESLRELFLINLLHGCLSREEMEEKQSELEMEGWFSGVRFAVIEVDDFFDRAEHYRKEKRQQLYYFKLWQTISKILHEEGEVQPLFLVKVENARFCCGFRRDDIEEQLFLDKVQRLIQRCKQLSVSLTVAVEPNVKAIGDLTRAFEQCSYMLRFKYSMGKGIILYVNDIPGASEMAQSPNMMDIQKELRYKALCRPQKERLALLEAHSVLLEQRDDLFVEYITLLNSQGQVEKAIQAMQSHSFHTYEGGEGLLPKQHLLSYLLLGRKAWEAGRLEEALEQFQEALTYPENYHEGRKNRPRECQVYWHIARVLEAMGRGDEAAQWDEKGLCLPCLLDESDYYKAISLRALGREQEAQEFLWGMVKETQKILASNRRFDYFAAFPTGVPFQEDMETIQTVKAYSALAMAYGGLGQLSQMEEALETLRQYSVDALWVERICKEAREQAAGK